MSMFCNQCEQTSHGEGCTTTAGVCGKTEEVAALQDLLVNAVRGLAVVANDAQSKRAGRERRGRVYRRRALHDSDERRFRSRHRRGQRRRAVALSRGTQGAHPAAGGDAEYSESLANMIPASTVAEKTAQGVELGSPWDTTRDLRRSVTAGDDAVRREGRWRLRVPRARARQDGPGDLRYLFKVLAALGDSSLDLNAWVGLALECGAVNLRTMELLDEANTETYGQPTHHDRSARPQGRQGDPDLRPRSR